MSDFTQFSLHVGFRKSTWYTNTYGQRGDAKTTNTNGTEYLL